MSRSRLTEAEILAARTAEVDLAVGYPELENPAWIDGLWRYSDLDTLVAELQRVRSVIIGEGESLPASVTLQELLIDTALRFLRLPAALAHRSALAPSGSHALDRAFAAVVAPGDGVLVPSPCIDIIPAMLQERQAHVFRVPGQGLAGPDVGEVVAEMLSIKASTVVLTSPDNPTGQVWSQQDLLEVCAAAAEIACTVVVDHCFANVRLDDLATPLLPATAESTGVSWLMVWDTGKFLDLDDEKMGLVVSSPDLWSALEDRVRIMQCTLPRRQLILLTLLSEELRRSSTYSAGLVDRLLTNLECIEAGLAGTGATVRRPVAGGLVLVELPKVWNSSVFSARLLADYGVAVIDASTFYSPPDRGRSAIRLALSREPDVFARGVGCIAELLNTQGHNATSCTSHVPEPR